MSLQCLGFIFAVVFDCCWGFFCRTWCTGKSFLKSCQT